MPENMSFLEVLRFIAHCSGDEAIELISKFQSGALLIEDVGADDFE